MSLFAAILGLPTFSSLGVAVAHAAPRAEASPEPQDPRFSLAPMIKKVGSAVVSIRAYGQKPAKPQLAKAKPVRSVGKGSGFVLSPDGLIVTNYHVVEGADSYEVRLSNGQSVKAELVGSDPATDIALLRIEGASKGANELTTVSLGQSEGLEVGDWVVAMGSPMGFEHSASVGIVSARGRGSLGLYADSYIDFLQTDADVAPGSSGGPLFDLRGEVVGITTAVGAGDGPGFAIPIDQARAVIDALRKNGEVVRGWLGAGHDTDDKVARIDRIYPHTPAARAGLQAGDIITAVDGNEIGSFTQLRWAVARHRPGQKVKLRVQRDGKTFTRDVTLGRRPGDAKVANNDGTDSSRAAPASSRSMSLAANRSVQPVTSSEAPVLAALGVEGSAREGGVQIEHLTANSLAAQAGLAPGDVLLEVQGQLLREGAMVEFDDTSPLELTIVRGLATHRISLPR